MESGGEQGEKNIQEFFNDVFVMMLKDSAIIAEGFLKIQKQKFTEEEYLFLMKDIMDNQVDQDQKNFKVKKTDYCLIFQYKIFDYCLIFVYLIF